MAVRWRVPDVAIASSGSEASASRESPHGVIVRRAAPADVKAVAAIERTAFADPWPQEAFEAQLARRIVWFAVAELDDQVVGYVMAIIAADEAEIANIAVRDDLRGKGIGAALLDSSLREARARSVASVYLEVRESNTAARRLYASRNFRKVGRRRGYYRNPPEDAIVLRWSLEPQVPPGEDPRVDGPPREMVDGHDRRGP